MPDQVDASKTAQAVAEAHVGNALVMLKQAANLLHQTSLENMKGTNARFFEMQAQKLDTIYAECFKYKP